jgi:hypothetical protein
LTLALEDRAETLEKSHVPGWQPRIATVRIEGRAALFEATRADARSLDHAHERALELEHLVEEIQRIDRKLEEAEAHRVGQARELALIEEAGEDGGTARLRQMLNQAEETVARRAAQATGLRSRLRTELHTDLNSRRDEPSSFEKDLEAALSTERTERYIAHDARQNIAARRSRIRARAFSAGVGAAILLIGGTRLVQRASAHRAIEAAEAQAFRQDIEADSFLSRMIHNDERDTLEAARSRREVEAAYDAIVSRLSSTPLFGGVLREGDPRAGLTVLPDGSGGWRVSFDTAAIRTRMKDRFGVVPELKSFLQGSLTQGDLELPAQLPTSELCRPSATILVKARVDLPRERTVRTSAGIALALSATPLCGAAGDVARDVRAGQP